MADFVRGNPNADYPPEIVSGIMLHRRIDKLTDNLTQVKQARHLFSQVHYRVAPIALDVLWDHFLSRYWAQFEAQVSLTNFITQAHDSIVPYLSSTPESFQHLNQYIWKERWLVRYAELPFIANTLNNMAIRRPKLSTLSSCIEDIERHYPLFEQIFMQFYPLMMQQAKAKNL